MSKKDAAFTLGLSILMGVLWVAGEVVMGVWFAVPRAGHIFWFCLIVGVTLIASVWHAMVVDDSDRKDPKREKYEKKTRKK
ncbi:MAG: hypothetical protein IJ874_06485 [Ruminococcus sp.]|nr:hypothetical protein [Ruminococcus sp.]